MIRPTLPSAICALALFAAPPAYAQYTVAGQLAFATGLEGGDGGNGTTVVRRARTRIEAGGDMRLDFGGRSAIGAVAFAEIEPHTAFGGEFRYVHWLGSSFAVLGGVTGTFVPHPLLGAVGGMQFHLPLGRTSLFLQPTFSVLPVGTDLPTDRPIFWALIALGARFEFTVPQQRGED